MLETFKKVDNPLTIIAIFSGITEVASSTALPFLQTDVQRVFVWFLILFPLCLVGAFFATLNFNPKSLYAPADYRDDRNFLQALRLTEQKPQVTVAAGENPRPAVLAFEQAQDRHPAMSRFRGLSKRALASANEAFEAFAADADRLYATGVLKSFGYGIEGDGLFLLNVLIETSDGPAIISRIIRTDEASGKVSLRAVGEDVSMDDPKAFAARLLETIKAEISRVVKSADERRGKKSES